MIDANEIGCTFAGRRVVPVASVHVAGETVIYHETARTIHVLNPSASLVWNLLDGEASIADLALRLSDTFGVDELVMKDQILDIVRQFGQQGLLDDVAPDENTVQEIRLDLLRSSELGDD
jgi:hypothetical protein